MTDLKSELLKRILILDGAMGTYIQSFGLPTTAYHAGRFANWKVSLTGNNDVLNITSPETIEEIHRRYIAAGADIITTNTFSANRISQQEYHCEDLAAEMALAGARIARRMADQCQDRHIWVAGSMGPTSKSLTLASDMNRPAYRQVSFDEMAEAYYEQAGALLRGGCDLLLLETCFDALNTKAALYAIGKLRDERQEAGERRFEVMVSATINDHSGRMLTGQTLEAFYVSISHYPILSFGLNCSFGVTELRPFVERLSQTIPTFISLHPNAGLPNEMGEYDELPTFTASHLREMAEAGLLNIAGGCCGTTDQHIRSIAAALKGLKPHIPVVADQHLHVSGLEPLEICGNEECRMKNEESSSTEEAEEAERDSSFFIHHSSFINVGERTNVAGSRKFARLIAEKKYDEAAQVARQQIEGGAAVIDINMDDAMLDSRQEMQTFLRYISNDPAIATAVLMIDSSDWQTVVEGLKNTPGKCIVNSISLKEGEASFIGKARELRRLGAAVVVMAFDEEGQATTYSRKISIAERAYRLLTAIGFPPQDIIFDVNILSVGTGISEHAAYGIDFIRAVEWIKKHLPLAKTSGGVSNLSFAFRGNNAVREAMHSAFLYHAIRSGLDMAIVNPSMLQVYDDIDPQLLEAVEDVILNRRADATERLINIATKRLNGLTPNSLTPSPSPKSLTPIPSPRGEGSGQSSQLNTQGANLSTPLSPRRGDGGEAAIEERLRHAITKGISDHLGTDVIEALHAYGDSPVAVIEQPLMQAMEHVGKLFGEGKMFLPQVVKSAKVMRDAVEILQPYLEENRRAGEKENGTAPAPSSKPVVLLATANGDVHDIGKNIVGMVLACNNFEVHDLGVMVPNEVILEKAKELNPVLVGVSGLITPSLKEMERLCMLFQQHQMRIPVCVGGATTSAIHTAVKLAPLYDYGVFYGGDASYTSVIAKKLQMNPAETLQQIKAEQQRIREAYGNRQHELISYDEANRLAPRLPYDDSYPTLSQLQHFEQLQPSIADVEDLIDWRMFLRFWGFRGESLPQLLVNPEARKTLQEGQELLQRVKHEQLLTLKTLLRFEPVRRRGNDIVFPDGGVMPMMRNQQKGGRHLCLADFFDEAEERPMGLFCVTSGKSSPTIHEGKPSPTLPKGRGAFEKKENEGDGLMEHALSARLVEAAAEWLQQHIYGSYKSIRPAFGYPVCPDHALKRILFDRIPAEEQLGITLTDHYSIHPSTTVCGLFIAHPEACYFTVGRIDKEQEEDYMRRKMP